MNENISKENVKENEQYHLNQNDIKISMQNDSTQNE